jgi:hypothetical protein
LRRILSDYESHHNQHRPHRSLSGAAPLRPLPEPVDLDLYHIRRLSALYRPSATMRYNALGNEEVQVAVSTSFRISDSAKARLASRAAHEGMTATALLDQLIVEGIDQLDYPGIIFRGPAHDRRAALAAGPDVWEIVSRLQELDGSEEQRISLLSAESDLHPRLIRIALDYAAQHAGEVRSRIDRNRAMAERSHRTAQQREALLG